MLRMPGTSLVSFFNVAERDVERAAYVFNGGAGAQGVERYDLGYLFTSVLSG